MKKNPCQNWIRTILGFLDRAKKDHVGAYAAQCCYFIILAFIPLMIFMITMVRYTPLEYETVRRAITSVIPGNLQNFILGIVGEVYRKNTTMQIMSILIALWSSGKGIQALMNGLNVIYHVEENRNWLANRLRSILYTLLFVTALVASLILFVMGGFLERLLNLYLPMVGTVVGRLMNTGTWIAYGGLFLVFLVMYKYVPNRRTSWRSQIPGAVFSMAAWSVFSYCFSLYFNFLPNISNTYGSLTSLIMVMMWLDICMILLLYGAEINAYFDKDIIRAEENMERRILRRKDKEE